jgi:uncharacterized protein YndB with AHSA1/START domain
VINGTTVVHEARYPHPVTAVWDAITDPAALAAWLMPNDFEAVVGRRFRFDARPDFGVVDGEVLEVDPPRLLRCRWTIEGAPTTVTIVLEPDDEGTVLRLEHAGLAAGPRSEFDGGWAAKLARDLALVVGGERDPARSRSRKSLQRHPDLSPET